MIEGAKKSNPMVIFLHGGPGAPIPFGVGCRGMFPEITKQVTMVYWDQLGCGINDHEIDDNFTIEHFVDMTVDLIQQLKADFKETPINIFGVSWGSVLAAKVALKVPNLIHKVLIYGQVLKKLSFDEEVYDALLESDLPKKYLPVLSEMRQKDTHSVEELKTIMKWVQKYTQGYQAKNGGKTPMGPIIWGLMTSPDYRFRDFKAIVVNGYLKNTSLLSELMRIDLTEVLEGIELPYRIFQGTTDIVTSTKMIINFMENTKNSNLSLLKIQNSGHMPGKTAMDLIVEDGFSFLCDKNK